MSQLTTNAVRQIYDSVGSEPSLIEPVVQVINIKKLPTTDPNSPERYRLIISDGVHFMQAMLSTQLNDLVHSSRLGKNAVVRINSYSCNAIQARRIAIVLSADVLSFAERIGDPASIEPAVANSTSTGSAPARPPTAPGPAAPQPPQMQIPPVHQGLGVPAREGEPADLHPISSLNPYQNRWTIRARVLSRSDIRTWKNARGEGKLFTVTLLDESGEIRATAFRDQVDQLYPLLEENKVYYISKARVNIAKPQFSKVQHGYELTLEAGTTIIPCGDNSAVPSIRFNFVPIGDLMKVEKDAIIDVIGIAKETSELSQIIAKTTQRPLTKREITLVDESCASVRLTLWGNQAEKFNGDAWPVMAIKGVRVGDFQGRSLSMLSSAVMALNPDIPESHRLRGWFDAEGQHASFSGFSGNMVGGSRQSSIKTFDQVHGEGLGQSEKPDYFTVKGVVSRIRDNPYYPACPSEGCNKKVTNETDGSWYCEKCQRHFGSPEYRYILSMSVGDITGQNWLRCFNETGIQIVGRTANELDQLKSTDDTAYNKLLKDACFKPYIFRCRAKQETYSDTTRVSYTVMDATPLEPISHSNLLLTMIQQYDN